MFGGTDVCLGTAPASAQVSDRTDLQVENLLSAGSALHSEMLKAAQNGCPTPGVLKAFEARIQRLSDERDSLTLHVPDFVNYYPNRIPWQSPNSLLTDEIADLRQTLKAVRDCGEFAHYVDPYRKYSTWFELSLGTYVIGLNSAKQTSIETQRLTDLQKFFEDFDDPAGAGVVASYLFAPAGNAFRIGPFASFDILRQTVNHSFAGGQYLGTTTHWFATAGAKAGAVVTPDLFLYGLTGVSWLNENLNINFATSATSNVTVPGVTLGFGGEYRPALWQIAGHPITLFAQYQHTWWRTANFYAPSSSPAFDYAFKREDDTVKLGVNFYFGASPAAPPSAPPAYPVKAPVSK